MSGGAGIVATDEAEVVGLPMPAMPKDAQARLKKILPFGAPANPLDCTAQALNDLSLFEEFARAALKDGGYRSILCFLTYVAGGASLVPRLLETLRGIRAEFPDRQLALCIIASHELTREYFRADLRLVGSGTLVPFPTLPLVLGALRLVHGEQGITIHSASPIEGTVIGKTRVIGIVDKGEGRGALLYSEKELRADTGALYATTRSTTFLWRDGGFGGPEGPVKSAHSLGQGTRDRAQNGDTARAGAVV